MQIVDYRPDHLAAWRALNEGWLAECGFVIEARDRRALDDPYGTYLADGGHVFMIEQDTKPVGCCALARIADGFEVSKMTVAPAARGQGLARRLLARCEAVAVQAGAGRLYLETNSALRPAIALYESAGFVPLPARPAAYARADVFMEKALGVRRA